MADLPQEQSQTPAPTETVTTPVETTQTLADVAKKYNVDQQVQNFTASPQQPQSQPAPNYPAAPPFTPPDPVTSPEQWNQYQAGLLMQNQSLQGNLRELTQTVQAIRQEATQARLDSEVNKAVVRVNDKLKVDPLYAEIALEKRYRDDPIFKRIWDNRQVNPKALEEALDVVSNELQGVFSVRQDPQLTENIRAAKQSQKTMATTAKSSSESEEAMGKSDGDFDRWWNQRKRGLI